MEGTVKTSYRAERRNRSSMAAREINFRRHRVQTATNKKKTTATNPATPFLGCGCVQSWLDRPLYPYIHPWTARKSLCIPLRGPPGWQPQYPPPLRPGSGSCEAEARERIPYRHAVRGSQRLLSKESSSGIITPCAFSAKPQKVTKRNDNRRQANTRTSCSPLFFPCPLGCTLPTLPFEP